MQNTYPEKSIIARIASAVKIRQHDIVLGVAIVLITVISFNMGKISAQKNSQTPINVTSSNYDNSIADSTSTDQGNPKQETSGNISSTVKKPYHTPTANQPVVASKKSSSKVYHFSWCPGASKISDKNKVTFANEAAAIAAGYSLAGNCQK